MVFTAAPASLISQTVWRVLPVVVLVLLILDWFAWTGMRHEVSSELQSRLHRQAEQYAQLIALKLETVIGTATSVAKNDLIVNAIMDVEGRDSYIPVFFETAQVPGLAGAEITLTDYKGRSIASNREDVDYSGASWLTRVLNGEVWHNVSNSAFIVAAPVMLADRGEGMIVIRYGSEQLARLLTVPARVDAVTVLADTADPVYSSNPEFSAVALVDDDSMSEWVMKSATIPGFDELELWAADRQAKAVGRVKRLEYYLGANMLTSIAAVVVAIVATAMIGTRPILGFIGDVEQITQTGDLSQTIKTKGTSEFHRLASAFNRMLESLQSTAASRDALQKLNAGLEEANRALDQAKDRFQLALRSTSAGVWERDLATGELYWSDQLKEMLGIVDPDFAPTYNAFLARLHPDDRDELEEECEQRFEQKQPFDLECRMRHEDGSYIWMRHTGQAEWDEDGNLVRMAGSFQDITSRKTAEFERDGHAAELERSNRELDDFAHIASHDLKEPLRAISNHARFLLEDYEEKLDEDGVRRLNRLIKLSHRMEKLITDLLFYSRIRKAEVESEPVDLNAIIADIDVSLADMMRQRNARLVLSEPLPKVVAARPHMRTVFQNLITNAIKYNDSEEKIIEIGFDDGSDRADGVSGSVFHVRDNGIGIDDAHKDDVFRIFKRLNTDKTYGEGTGAGLTFVKKIIENHGGEIWLESEPGKGTTFFFTLDGGR
ncbi:MAG: ATP-binding protein [Alphaproteobacteria bacterium]|nr:ATP-binding protein [Alphaproteobacteria bacterium]